MITQSIEMNLLDSSKSILSIR